MNSSCSDSSGIGIQSNPDLIGIGVRISIYLQVLLPVVPQIVTLIAPGRERGQPNDKIAKSGLLFSAAILITGYSMIFSAIIQATTTHLTVYHAVLTLNLNWLISLTSTDFFYFFGDVIPVAAAVKLEMRPMNELSSQSRFICFLVWLAGGFHLSLASAFGVWLFSDPERFDRETPGCTTETVMSMFWADFLVSAYGFKTAWLTIYCIFLFPLLNIIILNYFLSLIWLLAIQIWWQGILFLVFNLGKQFISDAFKATFTQHWQNLPRHIHPPKTITYFTAVKVLFIVSTELTIRHNDVQEGEGDWSFGQTLALFLTLPAISDALKGIKVAWGPVGASQLPSSSSGDSTTQ